MWTDDIIDFVTRLWQHDGLTATQIGRRIGKTRNAVIGKLHRLGMIGDGSHSPGIGGHNRVPKIKKVAPVPASPRKRVAREVERATPLAASPPPLLYLKPNKDGWLGLVAAIEALRDGVCHWPLPDGLQRTTGFCMAPCPSGKPYCPYHQNLAFKPANAPKEWYEDNARKRF